MAYADAVALTPINLSDLTAVSVATLAAADGTNGNKFIANKNTIYRVKNASGSQITVTVHSNFTKDGLTLPDKTFVVAATTGDVFYTGFTSTFWQDSDKYVWTTYSAVTTVTVAVYQP